MASSTTKAGPSTAASTNMLQPTNTAKASVSASLITATAAPAFTALGSPHASSTLSGAQSALRLQADVKVSSEIGKLVESGKTATAAASAVVATPMRSISELKTRLRELTFLKNRSEIAVLVELGESAGTVDFSKEETHLLIDEKIKALKALFENPNDPAKQISSMRLDLCKLSRISSTYYADLKEEIFNLLIQLLEKDPITQQTANGVLDVVIELNGDLAQSKDQVLTTLFQKKLARAFSAAVELFLRHYNMQHFNAVMEEQKKVLLETQKSFSDLNRHEIADIEFANQMAIEASKRLTSDLTGFKDFFERLTHFATAIGKAYNTDLAAFLSEFVQTFQGLDNKIKEKWFEALFVLRDLVQKAPDTMNKIMITQSMLATKKDSYDWKFTYGALEILAEIASRTPDSKLLGIALFGQSAIGVNTSVAELFVFPKETASLSAAVAQSVTPRLPGIVDFLAFHRYVTKAIIATESDRKADSAVQAKAKELCIMLTNKLSTTFKGRKLMLERYRADHVGGNNSGEKLYLQILENIIPRDPKKQKEWLKPSDAGRSIPHSVLVKLQHFQHTPRLTTLSTGFLPPAVEKMTSMSFLQQKQQGDKEKDLKQTASTTLAGAAAEEPISDFYTAVTRGDSKSVRNYISQNMDWINTKDAEGKTPLILAVTAKCIKICNILLKAGANPLITDEEGCNVMHWVAIKGHTEIARMFAADKQLINAKTKSGITPLMLAVQGESRRGWEGGVWDLLKKSTEPSAKRGLCKLILALDSESKGSPKLCELLLKAGADPLTTDKNGKNVMHLAASEGKIEIVRLLSSYKPLIDSTIKDGGGTPLMMAAGIGSLGVCEVLLKAGANPMATNKSGYTAMHCAASEGKSQIVRLLSAHKELLDSQTIDGKTPLILAAFSGHLEAFQILLKAGADALATEGDGWNAMHYAAYDGHNEMVRMLSTYKQLIDAKAGGCDYTPLMFAAQSGFVEVCELLLKAGANPLATTEFGVNALHLAAHDGRFGVVRMLAANRLLLDSKTQQGITPLMEAARAPYDFTKRECYVKACEILLKAGADPLAIDESGWNAMHWAASNGEIEIVKMLSVYKQLINTQTKDGKTPLMIAAEEGHPEVCESLLKDGANPLATDEDGLNAMHFAVTEGDVDIVRLLIAHKQLIDSKTKDGSTPLMITAQEGLLGVCELLLKAGANPLATDEDGWNAMHLAASNGKINILKLLLANKLLVHSKTHQGDNPLILAAENGFLNGCESLLQAGANPLAVDNEGQNAMHVAAENGKTEIVRMLLIHKPLIDSKTKIGNTPLIIAAQNGHLETCEALLTAGADPSVIDANGKNALQIAENAGKGEIVKLLSEHMKQRDAKK